ncbi:MAG: hypothetical protein LQ350_001035 [Teloschistes chrysophthalmus]|nr:MAG: hypothetical protein LQ350_001035 [Niorma chrysophthalma]
METTISEVTASAEGTDISRVEATLDAEQSQAFTSLLHVGHLSPTLARSIASLYRVVLAGNTFIHRQAEHHGIDSTWLFFGYCVSAYVGLTAAEVGMAFAEELIGLTKWVLWVSMLAILMMKVGKKKNTREVVDFLSSDGNVENGQPEDSGK